MSEPNSTDVSLLLPFGPFDGPELQRHAAALRSLARSLTRDDASADDLVQSTFLRAAEHPPHAGRAIAAWFSTVMRNEGRRVARQDRRREARESRVAHSEAMTRSSTADLVADLDARLELMTAVRELDALHREVILLRFFEDLPPRRIAARLGVPVKTVDSRIQRALERLRGALDSRHGGDRRTWVAGLLPLARPETGAACGVIGAIAMKVGVFVGVAALLVVGVLVFDSMSQDDGSSPSQDSRSRAGAPEAPAVHDRGVEDSVAVRTSVTDPVPSLPVEPARDEAAQALFVRSGRLVDSDGRPLPGVQVAAGPLDSNGNPTIYTSVAATDVSSKRLRPVTDSEGHFEFRCVEGEHSAGCVDPRYLSLVDVSFTADATPAPEIVLIAARGIDVLGDIVDESGVGIEGAFIRAAIPDRIRILIENDPSSVGLAGELEFRSRADGGFDATIPGVSDLRLVAEKAGYSSAERELGAEPSPEMRFVLRRTAEKPAILEGIVSGSDGGPLAGANVSLGDLAAETAEDGRFHLEYDATEPPSQVCAVAVGCRPVVVERSGFAGDAWPASVKIALKEPPLSISGTVYDPEGKPVPGAWVTVVDPTTVMTAARRYDTYAERLASGNLESANVDAQCDAAGRFRIDGLHAREYSLVAVYPNLTWRAYGRFTAGDDGVVIRFDRSDLHDRLPGRVVDRRGRAIAGGTVLLEAIVGGGSHFREFAIDPEGRFELELAQVGNELRVFHPSVIDSESFEVPPIGHPTPITLTVSIRCEVRVEVDASLGATAFALEDAEGRSVTLIRREWGSRWFLRKANVFAGRSERLETSDAAVRLVLYREGESDANALRRDIRLEPGQLNVLR